MWKYPDPFITPQSGPSKDIYCKTFVIKRTDNKQVLSNNNTNLFGYQGQGNAVGLKMALPGDATITGISVVNPAQSNTAGTGAAASIMIGRSIGFTSITAAGTTATVVCPYPHGLTSSDVIFVSDTGVTNFNTVGAAGTIQNTTQVSPTPDASDPTKFTYTIASTTATTTQGLIVEASYFLQQSVQSGGLAVGYSWPLAQKNIGVFAATTPTAYWQAAASGTFPGTPQVWSVSTRLSPSLGGDGNYNYFIEPTQDVEIYGYFYETATSGFTQATTGGPWVVFVQYFR